MRRKAILSLTVIWLILGTTSLAQSRDQAASPGASLKAITLTGPASSHQLLLRIEGGYTFDAVRATSDAVLIDLHGVRASGVAKNGQLAGDLFGGYHVLQYTDAKGWPVVRVQVNLKRPEVAKAERDPAGLRLVFGEDGQSGSTPQVATSRVALAVPKQDETATQSNAASAGEPVKVSGIKVTSDASGTTFVDIATTRTATFNVFRLSAPPRLVVDFEGAENRVPGRSYPARASYLRGVRVGQFRDANPAIVRVVADLAGEPVFDVHARPGGVRMELKAGHAAQPVASIDKSTPVMPAAPQKEVAAQPSPAPAPPVARVEAKSVEPETPKAAPESTSGQTPSTTAVAQVPAQAPTDFKSALPVETGSPEAAAAPKPETPVEAPEAIQAARAAMTLAGTGAVYMSAPQGQAAAPGQEQPKYTGEPISLNLKDVDLKDFFRLIHEISGLNIIVDPNVSGSVTLVLDAVPWDQALDIVLKNNRLGKTLEGNVLRIARVETLTAEQEAATKLAAAREEAQPLVTVFRPINYAKASTLATMIKSWVGGGALSKRGNILVDERTNTLIISDIQTQIPVVESIIARLDKKAKQVSIEARIVQANANFSRTLAASLSAAYGNRSLQVDGSGKIINGTGTAGGTGAGSTTNAAGQTPLVTTETLTGFGVYAITNAGARYIINAAIAAEETRGQAKTISRPTIVTQNNVPGTVTQGTQVPVQTVINNTPTATYQNAALTLRVTPQVTDDGNIFLDINVTNSQPGTLVLGVGNVSIDTQQATTQVLVPDGGTVVFGGVTITSRSKTATYVPLIGSIPVIGHLFKTSSVTDRDQELLFFVSPKVLPG
jgi:type IV pilus assembly protein PilQ